MKLATEKFGDERIDLEVDGNGKNFARWNDQDFTAATLKELREDLTKAAKRARKQKPIDVTVLGLVPETSRSNYGRNEPFKQGGGYVQAKLRAEHATRGGVFLMISDDDRFKNERFELGGYQMREADICRRLSLSELVEYEQILEAKRKAETALEDFIGARTIDAKAELLKARKGGEE